MYHMGISSVRANLGVNYGFGVVRWDSSAEIARAAQEYRDEPYAAYQLLVANYLADELLSYAMDAGKATPLVWRTDASGRRVSDVNQEWVNELVDITKGLKSIAWFVRSYVDEGGPALYPDSYILKKYWREMPGKVTKISDIAEMLQEGITNMHAAALKAAQDYARSIGANLGDWEASAFQIQRLLQEAKQVTKEEIIDPAAGFVKEEIIDPAGEALRQMEWADILKVAIPVGVGGLILYALAAKKR